MSTSETAYSFRARVPTILQRGRDQRTVLEVQRDGAIVEPVSGTYSLLDPSGSAVVSAVALSGVSPSAYFDLTAATHLPSTLALGALYQERWVLNMPDGTERHQRRSAALARFELHPPVADDDFTIDYPGLIDDLGDYGTNLQNWIDSAWRKTVRYITKHGDFPYVLVEPSDVFDIVYNEVLYLIFRTLFKETGGGDERWLRLMEEHKIAAEAERNGLRILPDRNQSGLADSQSRQSAGARTLLPNVGPVTDPRSLSRKFR